MGGFNAFQLADLEMDPYQHDCSLYKFSSENQKVEEAAWMISLLYLFVSSGNDAVEKLSKV